MVSWVFASIVALSQPTTPPFHIPELSQPGAGVLGFATCDASNLIVSNSKRRYSLQSVVKLLVGIAAFDAQDRGTLRLSDKVTVSAKQRSVGYQPLEDELKHGRTFTTTWEDLVARAIQESDSMACDILLDKLGGPIAVQRFLDNRGIGGINVDRYERELQSETAGLVWRPEYADAKKYKADFDRLTKADRDKAHKRYQVDPRDRSTPEAMCSLLKQLAEKTLLKPESCTRIMDILEGTVTYSDRLSAGIPDGWKFGHKTGSSGTWNGLAVATNDVGIARRPDGSYVVLVAFLADSNLVMEERNAIIASFARLNPLFKKDR
jgi:beta-lactamase class A